MLRTAASTLIRLSAPIFEEFLLRQFQQTREESCPCRSDGDVKTRCNRKRLPLFCYEIYLFDQLRYIRNTNPVNCVRRLCRSIYLIYTRHTISFAWTVRRMTNTFEVG